MREDPRGAGQAGRPGDGVRRTSSPQALARYRTLVVEACDGVARSGLLARLARQHGFTLRRPPRDLPHLDPVRPYHELLAQPGRLALDSGFLGELVYGPLRRGRSRLTWIEAFDFAEAVAARDGAFVHLTAPAAVLRERLAARGGRAPDPQEAEAAAGAYERALRTLAHHVPVWTLGEEPPRLPETVCLAPAPAPTRRAAARQGPSRPRGDQVGGARFPRIRAPVSSRANREENTGR
ncbi:hypothetical protein RKE29_16185 [Streptomyces sp. B1866]|uniref:hypothetical protein n=1 Tax=Streptomyces sp. B1866 TaxID=3075431 RepID=UPI00288EC9EA|nr:hypothetical protein [Streptomyces sp. B1866]MDT3398163.1 hypothetical protein [Streptomyces sp. B1866]